MNELARRFLHVNLNCASLDDTEMFFAGGLGLRARMRTDPTIPTDGSLLGLDSETWCSTSFLYDARGGRGGCALEAIEYRDPPLLLDESPDPVRPGIRAAVFTVADVDATLARLGATGAVLAGPDGVVVELVEGAVDGPEALFSGIRICAIDATATHEFLCAIGFDVITPPAPGDDRAVAQYALPEDADRFTLTVVTHPGTSDEPVPWGGNRQGLYRCALRVENLDRALAATPEFVERRGDPVWCPLPGTKIEGLNIAFLRSPDGVVFEYVERPLRFFG